MNKKYKIEAGFDISITVDVDLNKLTPEIAKEINDFWSGENDILNKSDGNIIIAAVRRSAPYLIDALLQGYDIKGAQSQLDESEGWAEDGSHGITLVDYEIPDISAYDVDVTEIT